MVTCNICEGEADLENEGGIQGYIGIIPFTLCVWCHAGMTDMVQSLCENCQHDPSLDYHLRKNT